MACAVATLNSTTGCANNTGGVAYSWACKLEDITAVTLTGTPSVISNFTMASTGLWKRLDYDKNDTSRFDQVGERLNETGALRYNGEAFLQFGGHNETYKAFADDLGDCCKLVFIHVLTNGKRVVQGIELTAATPFFTGALLRDTKVVPSQMSGTAAEEARLELLVQGRTVKLAPYTTITDTALAAL